MPRIAFLTASCMFEGAEGAREDAFEHTLEFAALAPACAARGIALEELVWDRPDIEPDAWDGFVVGTTWDYQERVEDFLARLESFAALRPIWNPVEILRWNLDKTYLRELEQRGVPIVPTLWARRVDEEALGRARERFGVDDIVAKPAVGAGAWRQVRLRAGEPIPAADALPPEGQVLLQPFLPSVQSEGELSFLFFGGHFSHALRKHPGADDYRVQSVYGGHERPHEASDAELEACRKVLAAVDAELLYARVDMLRGPDGALLLMELELVEPYLYPEQGPELGARFAAALERAISSARRR